ncbi:hypothetical protein AMELA_G00171070 [Ameiurus melas]|uniref:Uncharacterized protein n=1 Tax=Ameiurus melas TaxID=219545 RepID=A0A7J6AEH3_AMEME|nr:hypothetical protein AMELA_G00171070 [Ameiurus melas]
MAIKRRSRRDEKESYLNGYKAISKAQGPQQNTVRAIISKWKKRRTVVNLPRSSLLKFLQESINDSSRKSQKSPDEHLKNCRNYSAQVRSVFMILTLKKRGKNGIHGRVARQKTPTANQAEHKDLCFTFKNKTNPKASCNNVQVNFLEDIGPVTSCIKLTQHSRTINHPNSETWWW